MIGCICDKCGKFLYFFLDNVYTKMVETDGEVHLCEHCNDKFENNYTEKLRKHNYKFSETVNHCFDCLYFREFCCKSIGNCVNDDNLDDCIIVNCCYICDLYKSRNKNLDI